LKGIVGPDALVNLRRGGGPPLVIGHRGAAAVAPENTLEALQAAVDAGAHLVEFDIGPDLRLAHSQNEMPEASVSLDTALEFLRAQSLGVQLDLKLPGYETDVIAALRRHGLEERGLVSTAFAVTSRRLAALAPDLPRAIGYPRDRYGIARVPWPAGLTRLGAAALRQVMPVRAPLLIRIARANTLSLHHSLCSRAVVRAAHALGAPVLGWTANDPATVRRLDAVGVDAIISDDPGMALRTLATLRAQ
jgi:glycerophosphoryl diester phosphodiesterase